jgi:uncharacterized protein YndB with AHSA1/START domain
MTNTDTDPTTTPVPNPECDLLLERIVPVSPDLVLAAWTEPERIVQWFTPAPWRTTDAEVDLRPGGIFRTVMESPDGDIVNDTSGCVLEFVPGERFVFTGALGPGFRPQPGEMPFTATISVTPEGDGCRYSALVVHATPEDAKTHLDMGFTDGWGSALDQLVDIWGH